MQSVITKSKWESLTVDMSKFHSVPQKFPTLDSLTSPCSAQGLSLKHLSPGAHSLPVGQGVLFAQSLACSAHEIPQKFVLIIGAFDGCGVIGALDGNGVRRGVTVGAAVDAIAAVASS